MEAVDGGNHVTVFCSGDGEITFRVTRDGGDFGGIVEVDLFFRGKALDHEILGIARIFAVADREPFHGVAFVRAFGSGFGDFLGVSVVHMRVRGNQCRVAVVMLPEAVGDALVIPQYLVGRPKAIAFHVA